MSLDPIGMIVRNAIQLQRLANGIHRDTSGVLRAMYDEIVAQLIRVDPTAVSLPRYRRDRVTKLLGRVERVARESMGVYHTRLRNDLAKIGRVQGQHARLVLVASLGEVSDRVLKAATPTVNMMKSIIDTNPFRGETLKGWAQVQQQSVIRRVRQQIQLGMAREETIPDLVERVRGVEQTMVKRESEALVRTAVTEVANNAARITFESHSDVTEEYQYVATLDSRTTPICMSLDGLIFRYSDPAAPRPPQHWGCRSFIVAVIRWEELGLDPPDEGMRAARNHQGKTVMVPGSTSYEDWLRNASYQQQVEALGSRRRADLFRSGRMGLGDLIRSDGRFVTVAELERLVA